MLIAARCAALSRTKTRPESNGTLSHLCASADHESAPVAPSSRCENRGDAAAHSPNAPSTWTHAFRRRSRISGIASANGSNAPLFTFPA